MFIRNDQWYRSCSVSLAKMKFFVSCNESFLSQRNLTSSEYFLTYKCLYGMISGIVVRVNESFLIKLDINGASTTRFTSKACNDMIV